VQIHNMRETDEFNGTLGRIASAIPIALSYLEKRVDELDKKRPIINFCRPGGRSALATMILRKAGFNELASLAGGMLRWRAKQYPVGGGDS
jgi:rhodanese-related sulfurtransferase